MAVTLSNVSTGGANSGVTLVAGAVTSPQTSTLMTVASGDTALLVFIATTTTLAPANWTVHWDSTGTNQSCTNVSYLSQGGANSQLWGLLNPTSGNRTLNVTFSSGITDLWIFMASWQGTATDTIANAFKGAANNSGQAAAVTQSVTIPCTSNDYVAGIFTNSSANITAVDHTQFYLNNGGSSDVSASNYSAGSGTSVTLGATTGTTSEQGSYAGICIAAPLVAGLPTGDWVMLV